ncbi:MAG: HEAT repeat domain-containing protein [Candidatus Neomarinimicrobiota bacterium]|jgi:HEAT repeat protein|nr:HEAT repeat domain-containing protein [Candidatus Neomarinimicrobiota bacterium]MEC9106802.1 HEAT repeat domain-containing protein [Candidatus Neomarinimicrobiota bacterium]MED5256682.1 HEAT repeat domain-containing protein [Candidatus Neomarinimicrobiota bacterium]MED5266017.1 HEAT repeat domain-containing protein [Candidatus Neomarinimicrobiota bacterium]|tara:strand:+ start:428 stop:1264 length:837 start_codon:yes stop_codon:yes gene_type:complete
MPEEKKSVFQVIIHSFFVVPFIIAIFGVLIFLMVRVLTLEPRTAHDYLEDVKIGGSTKRWQGAFELSKILANPKSIPKDDRFVNDLISTYKYSENERDNRIQIYLALAMGRTRDIRYSDILEKSLNSEDEQILSAAIFSLGLIGSQNSMEKLLNFYDHSSARVRHQLSVALGSYNNDQSRKILYKLLNDIEPNVRWDAAISLAKQNDNKGRRIILDLMDRKYLDSFPNIDPIEQSQAMMTAIAVSKKILDDEIKEVLVDLMENDINMKIRQSARNVLE